MKEDIFILIESHRLELTYVEEIIANYFISKKAPLNIDKLAQTLAVSKASITRFCKKIGLDNYKELMFLYNLSLDKKEEPSISSAVTAIYHALATRSDNAYSEVEVDKLCALIKDHNIIHFFGKGFNSYTGADFSFKFSRFGKYVRVISEEKSILMSAEFAREGEMILVASLRGIDNNLLEAMTITKEKNIPIALITSNPNSDLIKQADITLISAGLTHEESIGIILNVSPSYARSQSEADLKAKKAADLVNIKSFLDPAVLGRHNTDLIELLKTHQLLPEALPEDEKDIAANTVDFIGLNYYQPSRVQAPEDTCFPAKTLDDFYQPYDWPDKTINPYRGWEIYPQAIYDVAMMMKKDYHNLPWFVSENGMGVADEERFMDDSGMIQDDYRIEFMKDHLNYLHQAIEEGSNCFAYHTWTFIDCWSWLNGYRNRYGFYRVDLEDDYKCTVKKSGLWYKILSEQNGYEE